MLIFLLIFFFMQKTAYEMRISDWSSDVCSSDLSGMDRSVALKVLPRHFASDPQFLARFTQEARVIANLEHQNILPVYDFGESGGYTYQIGRASCRESVCQYV